MKLEMENLSPFYFPSSNSFLPEKNCTKWTHEENKMFENALAIFDDDSPDRWKKIAAMIPGKTEMDVIMQYKELENDISNIEAGLFPIPGYNTESFTLEWVDDRGFDGLKQLYSPGLKRPSSVRSFDQERKKGIPWSEDEHRLFLLGLKKHGKGDWRNISRNFVVSRTPTQVASHAQKFFIRQISGGKDKRRSSIHDITTVNLTDTGDHSPEKNRSPSPDFSLKRNLINPPKSTFDWSQQSDNSAGMVFNPTHNNFFMPASYRNINGIKLQEQNFQGYHVGFHNGVFQMQCSQHHG